MSPKKIKVIVLSAAAVLLLIVGAVTTVLESPPNVSDEDTAAIAEPTIPRSHHIEGVKATLQETLKAGCETHACVSLLRYLGYDIDEFQFADNYLDCHYVYDDEATGQKYGPDMNSGFAGTAYAGWGIYAPAMAKCMNNYLKAVKTDRTATVIENTTLDELCDRYIDRDIPVMIWATTDMQEPVEWDAWIVNYVDENAKYKEGDTFTWMLHEHCLVLCGYDESDYYFSDSVVGGISHFGRALSEQRYEQLGMQAIVVQ